MPETLEELEETLAIMSDASLMAQVDESKRELASGESGASIAELRGELGRSGDAGYRADVYRPR